MPAFTQLSAAPFWPVSARQAFDIYLEKVSFVFVTLESFCEILQFSNMIGNSFFFKVILDNIEFCLKFAMLYEHLYTLPATTIHPKTPLFVLPLWRALVDS